MDPNFKALVNSRIFRSKGGELSFIVDIDAPTKFMKAAMSIWAAMGVGDDAAISAAMAGLYAVVTREVSDGEVQGRLHRRVLLCEIGLGSMCQEGKLP